VAKAKKRPKPASLAGAQFPQPRPIPAGLLDIADPALRQRAIDAWQAASHLRRLMEQWERWFHQLQETGDADPCLAIRLREAVGVRVMALCNLHVHMKTFQAPSDELRQRFPFEPGPSLQPPWQHDQEYRRQTQTLLQRADWTALLAELFEFLQLLETAPSVALPTPGAKNDGRTVAKKRRGRKALSPAQKANRESLVADWQRFKNGKHGQMKDFCADRGLNLKKFCKLLAAHRCQRRRDQESNAARTN
jgi:hypothetical protein